MYDALRDALRTKTYRNENNSPSSCEINLSAVSWLYLNFHKKDKYGRKPPKLLFNASKSKSMKKAVKDCLNKLLHAV